MRRVRVTNDPRVMAEFRNATGTVVDDNCPERMVRVRFDTPVEVPTVGTVTDDVFSRWAVKTCR